MAAVPGDLSTIDFDRTSRHRLLAEVVQDVLPAGSTILDIGGSEGLTAEFLPGYTVLSLDIRLAGKVDVLASATALPFRDRAFEGVSGLDLLEHVPVEVREGLVSEATRVSRELVVFAGPWAGPGLAATEADIQQFFVGLFDVENEWLREHAEMGLPDFEACHALLRERGFTTSAFGSNPLPLWSALQKANFVATRLGSAELHGALNRQLFEDLADVDLIPPSYRSFLVGTRSGSAPAASDRAPGDPSTLEYWQQVLDLHLAALVNDGMKRLAEYNQELERGWRETVSHVAEVEEKHRAAVANARHLEEKWLESLRHGEVLDRGWKQAAHRADTAQRTMYAYEQALFQQQRDWLAAVRGLAVTADVAPGGPDPERYRQWVAVPRDHTIPATGPQFSILTPVFNPDSRFLEACIRSVRAQTYPNWQLVIADVSTEPHVAPICRRFSLVDERLCVIAAENAGIAANTTLAAEQATGEWLVFLDHDDEMAPHALAAVARVIAECPEADFIYSDEDKLDQGRRVDPLFKPDWSPDLLRMVNYIGHLVAVRRSLYDRAGGLRPGFDGAQDYDFLLRATWRAERIVHIPDVLYHWRRHANSTAVDVRIKPDAHGAGRRALQSFADEWAQGAWVDLGSGPTTHRLRYPLRTEQVSIIIPFRDAPEVTDACLRSLAAFFNELPYEVLLVSNRSREEKTFAMMEAWEREYPSARCLHYDQPFNFQALNNWAVQQAEGSLLLFLNNDTEALHDKWIDGLAEHAQRSEVGVVGGRLFYPNGLVQHAGVVVGIGGFAEHPWAGLHPDSWTVAGPSYWVRNFLSVTAACMMVERTKFEAVAGFDQRFCVCGGDVDLGLRLHAAGYWNVMTPFVRLVHHESATRELAPPAQDIDESLRAYARYLADGDPFYNSNLTLAARSCEICTERPPGQPRITSATRLT